MSGAKLITVSEAARRLGVSTSTVRNWLRQGRLKGAVGTQPVRPRWSVVTHSSGQPLGHDGQPIRAATAAPGHWDRLESIERRMVTLESALGIEGTKDERFRDAALQLNAAMEHQRRAFQLQLEATRALDNAVAEQAAIIAGLLVGEPVSNVSEGHADNATSVVER